ncbi:polysaccharide deacetylase family protein [Anaerobacillus sp. MEB173]|uniref:polysaccharide deacetylase family protein n=1 Tax=Anaerobacillus sp. MEB173 TaxID=3383345 RepID=UPI003F92E78C
MAKRYGDFPLVLILVIILLLTGCGNNALSDRGTTVTPLNYDPELETIYHASQEQPEGGPEYSVRQQKAVSNQRLQRKYPNIIVLRGATNSNKIALTFDDGPDYRFTPQVLDVLNKHEVKATFFVMGARAVGHPDIIRRIHNEGHQIGNHTYWHPDLTKEGKDRLDWEIRETDRVLENMIGYRPKLFRAPYGALNEELTEHLGEMNQTVVGWSVDSLDWRQLTAPEVEKNVLKDVHPGSIILFHDGGHWTMDLSGTVQALDVIIDRLTDEGMEFVTISDMVNVSERK